MVGSRALRSLSACLALAAALAGCLPDLGELRQDDAASTGGSGTSATAGTAGSGGSASMLGGAGSGSASVPSNGFGGAPSAGTTSALPSAGSPAACVPSGVETCNGVDDDCNGVLDDGCPSGLSTVFDQDLPAKGDSPGGNGFTDDCPDGALLAGVDVAFDGWLTQVRGVCRHALLELSRDTSSGYEVRLVDETALAPHPAQTSDTVSRLACVSDEALVGVRLSQQMATVSGGTFTVIPKIWLSCAKLTVTKRGDDYVVDWQGKREMAPAQGSIANGTAWFAESTIPAGVVATRLLGAADGWVDRVGLGVSQLVVAVAR
jgi:hypothetical protein